MRALIGMGANLGDREQTLQSAATDIALTPGVRVLDGSQVYETDPVGGPSQPQYANAVLLVETALTPLDLLHELQAIELRYGRTREVHWGPRTLDLDLIDLEGIEIQGGELTVPHPRACERAFVMIPAAEVAPEWLLAGKRIDFRAAEFDEELLVLSGAIA